MNHQLAWIAAPFVLGLLVRLLRGPHRSPAALLRGLRDLVTLRMVLRDTDPEQRGELLAAHRAWRDDPAPVRAAKRQRGGGGRRG
ncbi:hypothetical protein Snoj_45210 [Streptomyces nojiriensis]|uniref:Uncharacterized protein n=1 Tax=Streptomyces nojiriensis TaxID=66374 RepID=A0ABQ3SR31_9ACTN|nr:hypothetical protein [Streptomyces nojiriensis]QTI44162.1 hypothetical protein JYK04_01925 [Streptomyces nojiriensis]GGS28354.1 hypothetical protein GCM10010205_67910 [Streptomyces nojiriensis]GHI70603.1 hypothetical protein Snoj_45210 [Streptomyces nojiriensis]